MIAPNNILLTPINRRLVLSICDAVRNTRFNHSGFMKGKMPSRMKTRAMALSNSVHIYSMTGYEIQNQMETGRYQCHSCVYESSCRKKNGVLQGENSNPEALFTEGITKVFKKVGIRFK